ncbi:uncharacterized protein LOC143519016 isoform X2 [Brachyhypopomus gauderio]|uniref:uncharacterized protein LOC143519016 isoform X2 n=1 Tax=Brachyhypopomus gauderio TaxID=698409 RepID=UPI0040420470
MIGVFVARKCNCSSVVTRVQKVIAKHIRCAPLEVKLKKGVWLWYLIERHIYKKELPEIAKIAFVWRWRPCVQSTCRISSVLYTSLLCHLEPEHLSFPIMERNVILPVNSQYPETDGFEAEEPQPYLEAKLYIERMEQEEKGCQKEMCKEGPHDPLPTEGLEPLEHGVSLTVYPIRVPSINFTCATVPWDVPHAPAEPLPSGSVDEINCRDGACLDWSGVDPLLSDTPSVSQEDIIDLIPEKQLRQTDTVLQQESTVTARNKENSFRMHHTQDMNENVCVTPSDEKDQAPFQDTPQTSAASADNRSGTFLEDFDQRENGVSIEDSEIQFCIFESSDALVGKNKETRDTTVEAFAEPDEVLGDAAEQDACVEHCSEDGSDGGGSPENGLCHFEEDIHWQQTKEPNLMEGCDLTHPSSIADSPDTAEQLPDFACGTRQPVEVVDYEKFKLLLNPDISQSEQLETTLNSEKLQQVKFDATLDMTSDEMVQQEQLQHAETLQESMKEDRQEEQACSGAVESSVEVELPEHTQQNEWLVRTESSEQLAWDRCSDEVGHCERSKCQEISCDVKLIGDFRQSEGSEIEPTEQSNESKMLSEIESSELSKQLDFSVEVAPLEHSNESNVFDEKETSKVSTQNQCSGETEPSHSTDADNTEQTQNNQQPQLQHNEQNEEEQQSKDQSGQTEQSLSQEQKRLTPLMDESVKPVVPYENCSTEVRSRELARRLAERLYRLQDVQRTDVVQHLDKDNDFSRAVGEEYLKFFDFTGQNLDEALRSFLMEVVLIGETQERERVLERFSSRYQQCNPDTFSSAGAVLTLTCAVMLLNTDLHGQNVGKAMSVTDFVSNLNGMNEGQNFSKDLLKSLYNSIKNHQLEWAVEEKYLVKSMSLDPESDQDVSLRSKSNPFQDIAHDKKATVFQKGFLKRKAHADIDGKRTPWGKRSWKTFYAVLKGMVLYLQKDEYRKDWQSSEEVLSIHHTLAERAQNYTKRPHVFRLQTADWRVFLFEAASTEQMNSWIGRINLVSALYSSPPFPAAVGSRRKFCRPILPATQSALTLEKQLQSHAASLQSFQEDLSTLQQGAPEGRKAKAREQEEHRQKEEYLQHEKCRYEVYVQLLEVWQRLSLSSQMADETGLTLFDQELWKGMAKEDKDDDEIDGGIKRSYSSPSLELEMAPPPIVKVRRNISERRTYRKIVIPRRNKEL